MLASGMPSCAMPVLSRTRADRRCPGNISGVNVVSGAADELFVWDGPVDDVVAVEAGRER